MTALRSEHDAVEWSCGSIAPEESRVDAMVARARRNLRRVTPIEAAAIVDAGGLLVDIRPEGQRRRFGEIPGALVIERNVLEWRLDPTSSHRHPRVTDPGRRIVVFCQEGYASSLAAASLQEVGLARATDLIGGFEAWAVEGLPIVTGEDVGRGSLAH